jgi:hypothetical protein
MRTSTLRVLPHFFVGGEVAFVFCVWSVIGFVIGSVIGFVIGSRVVSVMVVFEGT